MDLDKDSIRKLAVGFAGVSEVFVYTITGFGIGYYLDRWLGFTSPWLTVLLTLVGLIGGFYRLYKIFILDEKSEKVSKED